MRRLPGSSVAFKAFSAFSCSAPCALPEAYVHETGKSLGKTHDDQALREKTAKLWARLNNAPILPEHINCEGCRVDGIKNLLEWQSEKTGEYSI